MTLISETNLLARSSKTTVRKAPNPLPIYRDKLHDGLWVPHSWIYDSRIELGGRVFANSPSGFQSKNSGLRDSDESERSVPQSQRSAIGVVLIDSLMISCTEIVPKLWFLGIVERSLLPGIPPYLGS